MAVWPDALDGRRWQHESVPRTLQELGYELAQRALDQQESVLADLRSRTGTLLTATALVTTFLGARALDGGAHPSLAVGGLGFALISVVLCLYVLAPRRSIYVAISGPAAYAYFTATGEAIDDAYVTLAEWIQGTWDSNQGSIERLVLAFQMGCVMLVSALGLWSLGLALD
jgi:hypothetical protein